MVTGRTYRALLQAALVATVRRRRRGAPSVAHDHVQAAGELALGLPRLRGVGVAHPAHGAELFRVPGAAQVAAEAAAGSGAGRVADRRRPVSESGGEGGGVVAACLVTQELIRLAAAVRNT